MGQVTKNFFSSLLFLGVLCPLLWIFAMYMNEIPVTILLLLLAFMGCLVGGPNNIITSAVAADLADDPSIKGNNKVCPKISLFYMCV